MPETKPKFKPIILDRSRCEQYATCPLQAYLSIILDALKAHHNNLEVFPWERKLLDAANRGLIADMGEIVLQSTNGSLAECGTQIHKLIEDAFNACGNDLKLVPQWFVDNLPKMKPNLLPMAIRHARHVGDMVADYHVAVIGLEVQVSLIIVPETDTEPGIVATTRIDLLGSGKDNLHVCDWKTGFKRRTNSEAADSFQAWFIAFLLFQQKEYTEINTIHFWYYESMFGTRAYAKFERNEEHPRLPGLTTEVALKGRVTEAVKLFQADCREPWPLPEACLWCDVITFCPHASMEAKEIADDPCAFVDSLVVLQQLCAKRKKALTGWLKGHGPVEGTKVVYDRKKPADKFTAAFTDKNKPKGDALTGNDSLDSHFS